MRQIHKELPSTEQTQLAQEVPVLQNTGSSETVTEQYHYILIPLLHFSLGIRYRSLIETYGGKAARQILGSAWYVSSYVTD